MTNRETEFLERLHKHQGILHKICRSYAAAPLEREDLFQEISLQLWRAYTSFKGEAKFSTWMYRIALNTAINGLRKKGRRPKLERIAEADYKEPSVWDDHDGNERRTHLFKAIQSLSKVDRAIVLLFLEGNSYAEIAEIMGISTNLVGVKLNRIKQKLKKLLQPHFI